MLTSHYFVAETADAIGDQTANDWVAELEDLPDWAIEAAMQFWISRHNPKRAKKPLPGDISERAVLKCAMLKIAQQNLKLYEKYGDNPPSFVKKK